MIARLAEDVGAEHVQPLEPILIAAAASLDPARMRIVTETTRLKLDPDGVLAEQNRAHEHRWFACDETYGGVFVLRGELDKEGGALLKTAIDSLSRSLSRDDMRTASQRRADALVDLAAQHLQSGDQAQVRGQRPHLTVTVDVATLQGRADAPPAVLEGVGPIHAAMAQRIACDAARTVVTVNGNGVSETAQHLATVQPQPLSIGRTTRTIPAHIRTALHLRDGGCRFPGCDRPPGWTDGHHVQHWADGGATALENLVSLCRRHHRVVHEEGWHIAIRDGGAVNSQPP